MLTEAFTRGLPELLNATGPPWPFSYLPGGALMSTRKPHTSDEEVDVMDVEKEILQTVLDGLDALLDQNARPRRLKMKVLDMRDLHNNFWRVWAGNR